MNEVQELVESYGWNTLSYLAFHPDVKIWQAACARGIIPYKRVDDTLMCLAPICETQDLVIIVEEFLEQNKQMKVCFLAAQDRLITALKKLNPKLHPLFVGYQYMSEVGRVLQQFQKKKSLRSQVKRITNKNIQVSLLTESDLELYEMAIQKLIQLWQSEKGPDLQWFLSSHFQKYGEEQKFFIAKRDSELLGLMIAFPIPSRNGWCVEKVIFHPEAPLGLTEFMYYECVQHLNIKGNELITFGLTPLDGVFGWKYKMLSSVINHFYNVRGIQKYRQKFSFQSREPIYLVNPRGHLNLRMTWKVLKLFTGSPLKYVFNSELRLHL